MATTHFTTEEATSVAERLGIQWASCGFDVEQFRAGMDVEREHGTRDPETDVTGDDPVTTGKIALAHLREFPDYYSRLAVMEAEAEGAVVARDVVRAYHAAWTGGDIQRARSFLADGLDFQGSIDSFTSADAFAAALTGFASRVERVDLVSEQYGDREAALLYDCVTRSRAGALRTAEFFRLDDDGRICTIRLVFDATELRKLMPPHP